MVSTGLYDLSPSSTGMKSYTSFGKKHDLITSEMKDSENRIGVFPTLGNWESYILLDYFLIQPSR